jgi:type VI secretion system protein VasG
MTPVNLKSLIEKLNQTCRNELENAAGYALLKTNLNVEVEHWLKKFLLHDKSDIPEILKAFDVDILNINATLDKIIDKFKIGNSRAPGLSPDLVDLIKQTWIFSSIEMQCGNIRSGHILMTAMSDQKYNLLDLSPEFKKISLDLLKRDFNKIIDQSIENGQHQTQSITQFQNSVEDGVYGEALQQFTIDLVAEAKAGRIDTILGRDEEIRQIIDILSRRRQNNPILAGEAGVGKTAVVEGFALRVAAGDVPSNLKHVSIRALDLALMQAGAGVKGEFERRLKSLIEEVKTSKQPVILFIDEAHTMIGAGGTAGQGDAANLLKPALARGELRTIAATTWAEYKKYFEKDAALARRFQVIKVDEPDEIRAFAMIRGLVPILEKSHNVRILDEAVKAAVQLSARYIPSRQLPDKAVSVLDTACARVSVSQMTTPPAIEDRKHRIDVIDAEFALHEREALVGSDNKERQDNLNDEKKILQDEIDLLKSRWERECDLIAQLAELRATIEKTQKEDCNSSEIKHLVNGYNILSAELANIQGEKPLVFPLVDKHAIAEVVQSWTGIPTGRMQSNKISSVLNMRSSMERRVVGQNHAIESLAQALTTSKAGLTDPRKPVGVFLMAGPSGVGKTETALTLAELLYGGEQNLTTINMSEFKEEHKVSLLMGSPPGYVGYGEGGILTEAVRRCPYSVILLDEMEKAHPGVQDIFFQVFDKGIMRDGEGRDIDFKNTLIIMTSNAGSELISKLCSDLETAPDTTELTSLVRDELGKYFKDAFLGRVTVVPYLPLSNKIMQDIAKIQLNRIKNRISQTHKALFEYDESVVEHISSLCNDITVGARNIENVLTRTLLPQMSSMILEAIIADKKISKIHTRMESGNTFAYQITYAN